MTGPVKRTRQWWRRHVDGVHGAADAPRRVKTLWIVEVAIVLWLVAVALRLGAVAAGAVELDAWPPWAALVGGPLLGAAIGWGLPGGALRAVVAVHRWAVDRAERHGHVDVTDEDLPDDDDSDEDD